jgi:hypothetical protein
MRVLSVAVPIVLVFTGLTACSPKDDAESTAHTYQMGERVPLGHLIYAVFDLQWKPQIGTGVDARIPQNRFYEIRISVVNSGGAPCSIPNVSLVDDSGASYPEIEKGDGIQDFLGALHQVAPAESVQGYLVFDVQPKHYKLKLSDDEVKQFAMVDLPLSFEPETPDVTTPLDSIRSDATKK